ncbi:hypothetical protein GOP47_0009060 [Adiantum capillus-veneris]|uniref:RING-type E3 ubiquitin transferase n=1 Tax=Adiantum capillus-veneris TaxID=13818 RepID=A0A9D4UZI3_ADICA|nr:hypothetical protein GOP47_0009060 [Adiantum capillus-veneris]
MWKNLPWSIALLLLGFPHPQTTSRAVQDVAASPALTPQRHPSPLLPPPPFSPVFYDLYSSPPLPPPIYYPPPANTPFRLSWLLLALPVCSFTILFIFTYVRSRCKRGNGTTSFPASRNGSSAAASTWQTQGDLPANDNPQGGHIIDRSYISKLPTLVFSAGKRVDNHQKEVKRHSHGEQQVKKKMELCNTCAVCLSEYQEGELLKRLPACGHLFHKGCIDMWLFSHSTCPLCRLNLFDHKGDLILQNDNEEGLDLEHARSTSTPFVTPLSSHLTRCHSSNEHFSTLGIVDVNNGIQRSASHPMRRDTNNRVHPIDSSS